MIKLQCKPVAVFTAMVFVTAITVLNTTCFASDKKTQKEVFLTATIPKSSASFMVSIPENVSLGQASIDKELVQTYEIGVDVQDIGTGAIQLSAEEQGFLCSGKDQLKYTMSFDTKHITKTETVSVIMKIGKEDILKAKAGDYEGTADFAIKYIPK